MTYQVISDVFSQEIADINVEAVLFTTYNLELSFFETEVVPLLFNNVGAFSNDVRIKELQVREKLESSKIVIDLFYDEDMFYQEQQRRIQDYLQLPCGCLAVGTKPSGPQESQSPS